MPLDIDIAIQTAGPQIEENGSGSVHDHPDKGETYVGTYQDLQCQLLEEEEPVLNAPQTYTMVPVNQDQGCSGPVRPGPFPGIAPWA